MKIDPDEITAAFAASDISPEIAAAARAFEEYWDSKGVPAMPGERLQLGFNAVRLMKAGCSRELLFEYLDAALDEVARLTGERL